MVAKKRLFPDSELLNSAVSIFREALIGATSAFFVFFIRKTCHKQKNVASRQHLSDNSNGEQGMSSILSKVGE